MNFEKKLKILSTFPCTLGVNSWGLNTNNFESSYIETRTEQVSSFQLHVRSNGTKIQKEGTQKWKSVKEVCRVSGPSSLKPEKNQGVR